MSYIVPIVSYMQWVYFIHTYGVMYSAHDGIHLPPVMSYSWCYVFDRVGVVIYIVDVMTDRMCFKSDIELAL